MRYLRTRGINERGRFPSDKQSHLKLMTEENSSNFLVVWFVSINKL